MKFPTERRNEKENFPFPKSGEAVFENPPTFIWLTVENAEEYTLEIFDKSGKTIEKLNTGRHFATPSAPLAPGEYSYRVSCGEDTATEIIPFSVSPDALTFIRPTARELLAAIPDERPRHLFGKSDVPELIASRRTELAVIGRNAILAYAHGLPDAPRFDKDPAALPYREYFGRFRDYVDRDLIATAELYALTGDERAGAHAKSLLLRICDNSLDGDSYLTASALFGKFGDEVGLSIARCFPAAFDMLYPLLTAEERDTVARVITVYARQCKARIEAVDYAKNPSNSHVGRLPAYLGEAAVALFGTGAVDNEELLCWLELALEIYSGIFPYYGGADGSWAEGAFYATSYSKWYLPFFSLVERFTGKSMMQRPFYHRFTSYLYHFAHPDYEIHPFGDGYWCSPDSPEWPGFFAENPFRYYAEKFGPAEARELSDRLAERDHYSLHLLDLFLPTATAAERTLARSPRAAEIFPDGGFAVLHTDPTDPDRITVMARASRFGSDSHRHADQGSFAIFVGGKALISPSGYFGREFGTAHHRLWTQTTKAHNSPLIDGVGQKTRSKDSRASIRSLDEKGRSVILDLADAYESAVGFEREISLDASGVTVTDRIVTDTEREIFYPLHTLSEPTVESGCVTLCRGGFRMKITALSGDLSAPEIRYDFDTPLNEGVPEEYAVSMPPQYHVGYRTPARREHIISVRFEIEAIR